MMAQAKTHFVPGMMSGVGQAASVELIRRVSDAGGHAKMWLSTVSAADETQVAEIRVAVG
jgi:hypothetical protein